MSMMERAIALLSRDAIHHTDMLEPIRRGTAVLLDVAADGVFLRETGSEALMMTAERPETAARFLAGEETAQLFVAHQPFYVAEAAARYGLSSTMACYQAVWPGGPVNVPDTPFAYRLLDMDFLPQVERLYSHAAGDGYLAGRIAAGEMFGAFDGDVLAGIIGLHEEGSMGMLEVDPAFRRRGVGAGLLAFLANGLLARGWTPFSQFVEGNDASRALHEKLGFAIADRLLYWLEV